MTVADLTYKQLQKAVADLGRSVAKASGAIRATAQQIDDEARDTARVAEMIGAMGVDTATTAETSELSRLMQGLSEASIAYASAGDTTAKAAGAAHEQAHTTHGGIHEAVSRAPVDRVHDVNRDWFRQE